MQRRPSIQSLLRAAAAAAAVGCRGQPKPSFVRLAEARRLVAEMRADFAKASDASDRAVLADTDEQSVEEARLAEASSAAVAGDVPRLAALLDGAARPGDAALVGQFQARFERYRTLDARILGLAVENTNLKAQKLSFGPVREAADAACAALEQAAAAAPARGRDAAHAHAARAALAVREIQFLQALHIAATADAEMDRLEAQMTARRAAVTSELAALAEAGGAAARAPAEQARADLATFDRLSGRLLALSRKNTNVLSLQLALRDKPPLTAACDQSLVALSHALAREGFSGTR
jgi:hypothetical protein